MFLAVFDIPGNSLMQRPARPFESLEWYREASRREARPRGFVNRTIQWLRSFRFLAFHVGLFALGITIALAINVARTPGTIWVDRMALSWVLLLVVHAAIIALLFAIGLLGTSEQRLPVYVPQNDRTTPRPVDQDAPGYDWPAPPPRPAETSNGSDTPGASDPNAEAPSESSDGESPTSVRPRTSPGGWPGSTPTQATGADVASWREVSPSAWIRRKRSDSDEAPSTDETPPTTSEPDHV